MEDENILLEMNVQEIFKKNPSVLEVFNSYGLECRGCHLSKKVSLKEALESSCLSSEGIIQEIMECLDGQLDR